MEKDLNKFQFLPTVNDGVSLKRHMISNATLEATTKR